MSIATYARELEILAKQFEDNKITYEQYITECNKLGEMEVY